MWHQWMLKALAHGSPKVRSVDLGVFDYEVMGTFAIPLPLQQERKGRPQGSILQVEPRLGGQVVWEYDSDYGCGYDDKSVFPPDRHPVGVGVLEKIDRLPSFPVRISYNEEVMQNAENDAVANASCNRTLQWGVAWVNVGGEDFCSPTHLICEVVKETPVRTTSGPCYKDLGFFVGSVGPGHHNPYRAASRGRVVRL